MAAAVPPEPLGVPAVRAGRLSSRWMRLTLWAVLTALITLAFRQQPAREHGSMVVGVDFRIYWAAGRLANQGHDPYVPVMYGLGFVYPPFALLPFRVLGHLSRYTGFSVWMAVTAALLAALLVIAARRGVHPVLLLLAGVTMVWCGYVFHGVEVGQVGLLLLLMVVCDLVVCDGRRGQGVLTGLAIGIKFTPAVFLLWFVARRQWRAALVACLSFVGSVVLGFITAPGASRLYWRRLLVDHRLGVGVPSQYGSANNQSITNAVVVLFGHGALGAGRVLALVLTMVGLLAGFLAARRSAWLAVALLGTASCLASSSTWDHHYVWMLCAIIALVAGDLRRLPVTGAVTLLWTVWSVGRRWRPLARIARSRFTTLQVAEAVATPVLAALLVLVAAAELWRTRRGPAHVRPTQVASGATAAASSPNARDDRGGASAT